MNVNDMVDKYLALRAYIEREDDAHKAKLKPYRDGMAALLAGIAKFADDNDLPAVRAASGTAFPVEQTRVRCEDRDAFHDFVFANNARQFLTSHVTKEAVKEWVETHEGHLPPGISMERSLEWQVRKA